MILVTGAAGRLGNRVVQRLVDEGREVVGSDRRPCPENFPTTFIETDLCDHTSAWHVSDGADAVVHMGAIPGPGADPDETFHNNMMSTFHVMRAAQEHGTRRIVFSSSAFGMGWAHDPAAFVPDYRPLDEDHLMMPFEPYGLTKQLGEGIGAMVARSSATTVVSLRFTNVVSPERQQEEFPWEAPTRQNPRTLVMWAYADPRDVAEAHVRAVEADLDGHTSFMIAQPTTRFVEPTLDLIRANFGDAIELRDGLDGVSSVISTRRMEAQLGFRPGLDWREGK